MITGAEAEYQSGAGSENNTPHLALPGELGVYFVNICEKIDRFITASHCMYITALLPK